MKLTDPELSALCLELSVLLRSGMDAGTALTVLSEEYTPQYRPLLRRLAEETDSGQPLSAALKDAGCFPSYLSGLVEVGERTGRTGEALSSLSRYYEAQGRLGRQLRQTLLYPSVTAAVMLAVIAVLLTRVLPIFDDVYASLGGRLDALAGYLLDLGYIITRAAPGLAALLCLTAALLVGPLRRRLPAWWRGVFGDRGLSRRVHTAQAAQAIALGTAGGLDMEAAVCLASGLLDASPAAKARCLDCLSRLEGGAAAGTAARESGLLPGGPCRLLDLAQRSGTVEDAMEKIARDLAEEAENELAGLAGRVELGLMLACSLLIGLILLSVMLPLTRIMSALG